VVDELAGAAELVKGKSDQVPVAVVRGYLSTPGPDGAGAVALVRDAAQDLFSLGTAEARALGLREAARLADTDPAGEVDRAAVDRALATVAGHVSPGTRFVVASDPVRVECHIDSTVDQSALIRFGADVHRLRAALAAEGIASALHPGGRVGEAGAWLEL
jgi:coenzyme F420-0:L-glutamate ligase / coenzyme F420-1:gamma-L-glutamate ligase